VNSSTKEGKFAPFTFTFTLCQYNNFGHEEILAVLNLIPKKAAKKGKTEIH
jgi:hypothetical protein